ncbi:DUF6384 family protein [Gilliamella sp. A7]|uniref:DUF6384 family protein n=1 Tax=Gilliamella sp. A7 TaxID=1970465 RepID=UPI000A32EE88|nr:DUF6384 family protein [Gilliamella sp. A7]OTQ57622.1 hypothetical protein B6D18_09445 [Gilliamella sp. A7]
MSNIKLSDQLGAMAIIDELYQKQQLLLEHLDHNALRTNLAENIKNYYQAKGQIVNDEIIKKGINLWFNQRLQFIAPKRSWLVRFFAFCYIKRNTLYPFIGVILVILLFINLVLLNNALKINDNIDTSYSHILSQKNTLNDLNNKFLQVDKLPVHFAQVPVKKLKDSITHLLNQEINLPVTESMQNSSPRFKMNQQTLNDLKELDNSITSTLPEITRQITELSELLEKDKKLANLIQSKEFIEATKKYPILQISVDKILDKLNQGQQDIDVESIESLYNSVGRAETLENKILSDSKQLKALNVPNSDMSEIIALQNALSADLKNLNFEHVEHYQEMMAYYIKLAQTNLTLTIVDHPDYKSGVERTHDNTNGKSWYLIVRPMTTTNHSDSLWVQSIETGESKLVNTFGQQVTLEQYNSVKTDKMQDGHIDNNKLCTKPKGRLIFNCPKSVKSGRILEW